MSSSSSSGQADGARRMDGAGGGSDADLELPWFQGPAVAADVPEREGPGVEVQGDGRGLARSEADLAELLELLVRSGDGGVDVPDVELHHLPSRSVTDV